MNWGEWATDKLAVKLNDSDTITVFYGILIIVLLGNQMVLCFQAGANVHTVYAYIISSTNHFLIISPSRFTTLAHVAPKYFPLYFSDRKL